MTVMAAVAQKLTRGLFLLWLFPATAEDFSFGRVGIANNLVVFVVVGNRLDAVDVDEGDNGAVKAATPEAVVRARMATADDNFMANIN